MCGSMYVRMYVYAKRSTRRAATQRTVEHGARTRHMHDTQPEHPHVPRTRVVNSRAVSFSRSSLVSSCCWLRTGCLLVVVRNSQLSRAVRGTCRASLLRRHRRGFLDGRPLRVARGGSGGRGFSGAWSVYIALLDGAPQGNLKVASQRTTSFSLEFAACPTVVFTASWPFWCPRLFRLSCGTVYTTPAPAQSLKSSLPASFPG